MNFCFVGSLHVYPPEQSSSYPPAVTLTADRSVNLIKPDEAIITMHAIICLPLLSSDELEGLDYPAVCVLADDYRPCCPSPTRISRCLHHTPFVHRMF
jgi:hypothetical protein